MSADAEPGGANRVRGRQNEDEGLSDKRARARQLANTRLKEMRLQAYAKADIDKAPPLAFANRLAEKASKDTVGDKTIWTKARDQKEPDPQFLQDHVIVKDGQDEYYWCPKTRIAASAQLSAMMEDIGDEEGVQVYSLGQIVNDNLKGLDNVEELAAYEDDKFHVGPYKINAFNNSDTARLWISYVPGTGDEGGEPTYANDDDMEAKHGYFQGRNGKKYQFKDISGPHSKNVIDLLSFANSINDTALLNACAERIAQQMRGRTVKEIREIFGLPGGEAAAGGAAASLLAAFADFAV